MKYVYVKLPWTDVEKRRMSSNQTQKKMEMGNFTLKRKGRDVADDPEWVIKHDIPLDTEYYYIHKVKNPVLKFFRHIVAPVENCPKVEETMSEEKKKKWKKKSKK